MSQIDGFHSSLHPSAKDSEFFSCELRGSWIQPHWMVENIFGARAVELFLVVNLKDDWKINIIPGSLEVGRDETINLHYGEKPRL